jgi:hypothetical protein
MAARGIGIQIACDGGIGCCMSSKILNWNLVLSLEIESPVYMDVFQLQIVIRIITCAGIRRAAAVTSIIGRFIEICRAGPATHADNVALAIAFPIELAYTLD